MQKYGKYYGNTVSISALCSFIKSITEELLSLHMEAHYWATAQHPRLFYKDLTTPGQIRLFPTIPKTDN